MNQSLNVLLKYSSIGKLLLLALMAVTWPTTVSAATDKDILLLSKAVGFVEGGGGKDVAVLFDAASAASSSDADSVIALLGGAGLNGTKVPVSGAASASAKVLYVTSGLNGSWDAIAAAGASGKKITATLDDGCVKAGKCVLGIQSTPSVEIKVSKAAAAANGVSFGVAFRMMIKEY
jgi:hypothetical protein